MIYTTSEPHPCVRLLYHQAHADRRADRPEGAARLIEEMARRFPSNRDVRSLAVRSLLLDRQDARGALNGLAGIAVPLDTPRVRDAYAALGLVDSARTVLTGLAEAFPADQRIKDRLERLRE